MTAQDNQGRLPTDTETPQTPATRDISLRVSCLQTQQLISQFPFFSFISLISVVTIGILYWQDSAVHLPTLKIWFGISLASIAGCIFLMRHLQDRLKQYSHLFTIRAVNTSACVMGLIWGIAAVIFIPSLPKSDSNFIDFYRPALFICLVSWQAIAALTSYASRFETFISFAIAAILPGLLWLMLEPSPLNSALAGVAGLFFFFVILASRRLSDLSYQSLWLQLRNEDLIHFLESSKSTVESTNQRLSAEVQDRKHTENLLQETNLNLEQKVRERTLALSDINRALRNSQERLTLAIDAAGIGLWDWNLTNNEIYHSNFEQLLGYSKLELKAFMGKMQSIIHPDDYSLVRHALVQHLRKKKPSYEVCYRIQHRAGHWIWVEDSGMKRIALYA